MDPRFSESFKRAQERWPLVKITQESFLAHCRRVLAGQAEDWERLHLEELYLAFACAQKDARALEYFRSQVLTPVLPVLRGVDPSDTFVEEMQQQLLERLFVAEPGQMPRIGEYAGRSSLEHWLRAVTLRFALNAKRNQKRRPELSLGDAALDVAASSRDLQLELLKARYGADFSAALQRALHGLSAQERNILKLHFLEGMSLNQIGVVYQANKSTISRWMGKARESLLERTRTDLEARLGIVATDLDSLMRAMGTQLEVSLSTALRSG